MVELRVQKGGESDELLHDMGRLLLDLFRARILSQLLFVRVRKRSYGPAASAARSWARRERTYAFGGRSDGAWTGYGWTRASCGRRACGEHAYAAGGRGFAVQLCHANGVPGMV